MNDTSENGFSDYGLYEVIPQFVYQFRHDGNITFIRTSDSGWIIINPMDCIDNMVEILGTSLQSPVSIHGIFVTNTSLPWWSKKSSTVYVPLESSSIIAPLNQRREQVQRDPHTPPHVISDVLNHVIPICDDRIMIDDMEFEILYTDDSQHYILYTPIYFLLFTSDIIVQSINAIPNMNHESFFENLLSRPFMTEVEVRIASYHSPTWGNHDIIQMCIDQRNLYRVLFQQTIFCINQGMRPLQIRAQLRLPSNLPIYNQECHGTYLEHIQYIYDKHVESSLDPKHMIPLPDYDVSKRLLKIIGDSQLYEHALDAFNKQEYEWAVYLLNILIYVYPDSNRYRDLLASIYQELAEQQVNPISRNRFIHAVHELIEGVPQITTRRSGTVSFDTLEYIPTSRIIDYIAVHMGFSNASSSVMMELVFTDKNERVFVVWDHGALFMTSSLTESDLKIIIRRDVFIMMMFHLIPYRELIDIGLLQYSGDILILEKWIDCIVDDKNFSLIESLRSTTDHIPLVTI